MKLTIRSEEASISSIKIFKSSKLKTREHNQEIKGFLAHEFCHLVMNLVYENGGKPYFKHRIECKTRFEEIVNQIYKWTSRGDDNDTEAEQYDDECNGLISSVFQQYKKEDFHAELIARVVQILVQYCDNDDKSEYLQNKYKILFDFWQNFVVPDLLKFNIKHRKIVQKFNQKIKILSEISNESLNLRNSKNIEELFNHKLVIVTTNVPKLLLINIYKHLYNKYGNLCDAENVFVDSKTLNNREIFEDYQQLLKAVPYLTSVIDCTKEIVTNFNLNGSSKCIFIVSDENDSRILLDKLVETLSKNNNVQNQLLRTINYAWTDLTIDSQKLLLQTKINFQNNKNVSLYEILTGTKDLKADKKEDQSIFDDFLEVINCDLLNHLLKSDQITINLGLKTHKEEENFNFLHQLRKFIKNKIDLQNYDEQVQNSSQFEEMTEDQMFLDVKCSKYVVISDVAGNGKTWMMKKFHNEMIQKVPTKWVTYVDLKEFVDEFKTQKDEIEFATLMVDKILKTNFNFEKEIFKHLYKNGRVCVFFDGFNEVPVESTEVIVKLISKFRLNGGNQLWIATRDYMEDKLVNQLNVDVTYKLKTLNIHDGCDLIAKSWIFEEKERFEGVEVNKITESKNFKDYESRADGISKKLLKKESKFIGLPIIYKMIAEISANHNNLIKLEDLNSKSTQSCENHTKIFTEYIKVQFKKWSMNKRQITLKSTNSGSNNDLNSWKIHQYIAMIYLFPNYTKFLEALGIPDEEIIACGLVIKINNRYYFVHETFAEFFAADYISKMLLSENINESLIVEVLLKQKYKIIRIFLDDMLKGSTIVKQHTPSFSEKIFEVLSLRKSSETTILNRIADSMEMDNLSEFFINNLEFLTDLIILILKRGEYEEITNLLKSNSSKIFKNSENSHQFHKFLNFLLEFTKISDLKEIIKEKRLFIKLIQSNFDIFEEFVDKIYQKTDKNFIKDNLKLKSKNTSEDNIVGCYCWSGNQDIEKFVQILQKYLNNQEILELMENCNKNGENVLHICVQRMDDNLLRMFWMIMENLHPNFEEFITKTSSNQDFNILHFSAFCHEIDFHLTLWNLLLQNFNDREKLSNLINQKDNDGFNFVHLLIKLNKPKVLELIIIELKNNFSDIEYQNILNSQDSLRRNLLQHAAVSTKELKIHQILWKIFQDSCKSVEEFLDIVTEMDKNSNQLLHTAACFTSREIFEFMIYEIEKIASMERIKHILEPLGTADRNLLQLAASYNKSLEIHEFLWHLFFKYFNPYEIVKIMQFPDEYGHNLFQLAIRFNSKEVVELTWNKIKNLMTQNELVEYLKSMDSNILKLAVKNKENSNVVEFVAHILQEYEINENFQEAGQSVDLLAPEKSEKENSQALIEAVKNNNLETVQELLKSNHDIDYEDNQHKSFIDYAWINFIEAKTQSNKKISEKIILELLNANSQFPKKIFNFKFEKVPKEVQKFIDICESMHRAVEHHDTKNLNKIIKEFPHLRFFYDRFNESVLIYALKRQRIDALDVIKDKLSIRHDESLSEIFYEFSIPDLEEEINSSTNKLPHPQILLLIAKSRLQNARNPQKCWSAIYDAFLILNEVDSCSKILKITSIWKQLRINFDFSKEKFSNFISPGTVIIGAKNMDIANKFEVIGSIAHELNHLAIQIIFMNKLNPFPMGESAVKLKFIQVCKNIEEICKENPGCEVIVKRVFDSYNKITQPSELIVRPMQIVMHYYESAAKINKNQRIFNELFNYFVEVVLPELEKTIPVLKMLQKDKLEIEFDDLTESMKAKILHSKILFQDMETTFFDIIGDDQQAQESILENLSSENIKQILLNDEKIKIVSNIELGQERFVIERNYIKRPKDNKADNDKNDELTLKEIAGKSRRFILMILENFKRF